MQDNYTGWSDALQRLKEKLLKLGELIDKVGESTILPILAKHYDSSNIKTHNGLLKTAIIKRGAYGNIFKIDGVNLVVGVDDDIIAYADFVLDGRPVVVPRSKKALRWFDDNGKPVFSKRSGPVKPHDIYYLTGSEIEEIEEAADKLLAEIVV